MRYDVRRIRDDCDGCCMLTKLCSRFFTATTLPPETRESSRVVGALASDVTFGSCHANPKSGRSELARGRLGTEEHAMGSASNIKRNDERE